MSKKKNNKTHVAEPVESVVTQNVNNENSQSSEEIKEEKYYTMGDKKCYVYFNLQLTGLRRNADIISLALTDNNGRSLYAEFTDYNPESCDEWVNENVISALTHPENVLDGNDWTITGTRKDIRTQIYFWLDWFIQNNKMVQFVGDTAHLSFVLLQDLLVGDSNVTTLTLPNWISPALEDLNQDIAAGMYRTKPVDVTKEEFDLNYAPVAYAFMINRKECADVLMKGDNGNYHNALDQVKMIQTIHLYIWQD